MHALNKRKSGCMRKKNNGIREMSNLSSEITKGKSTICLLVIVLTFPCIGACAISHGSGEPKVIYRDGKVGVLMDASVQAVHWRIIGYGKCGRPFWGEITKGKVGLFMAKGSNYLKKYWPRVKYASIVLDELYKQNKGNTWNGEKTEVEPYKFEWKCLNSQETLSPHSGITANVTILLTVRSRKDMLIWKGSCVGWNSNSMGDIAFNGAVNSAQRCIIDSVFNLIEEDPITSERQKSK